MWHTVSQEGKLPAPASTVTPGPCTVGSGESEIDVCPAGVDTERFAFVALSGEVVFVGGDTRVADPVWADLVLEQRRDLIRR